MQLPSAPQFSGSRTYQSWIAYRPNTPCFPNATWYRIPRCESGHALALGLRCLELPEDWGVSVDIRTPDTALGGAAFVLPRRMQCA
jgi:hypothetical protein